jgi:hypothetical protein
MVAFTENMRCPTSGVNVSGSIYYLHMITFVRDSQQVRERSDIVIIDLEPAAWWRGHWNMLSRCLIANFTGNTQWNVHSLTFSSRIVAGSWCPCASNRTFHDATFHAGACTERLGNFELSFFCSGLHNVRPED